MSGVANHLRVRASLPLVIVMIVSNDPSALGTVGGTLITLTGMDPVKLLVYSALINGLLAVPFLNGWESRSASRGRSTSDYSGPRRQELKRVDVDHLRDPL
jgi:hypothetical protein